MGVLFLLVSLFSVNPFDMNGNKFNDLVAALNGFNFFAFYKGFSISGPAYRRKTGRLLSRT